MTVNIIGAGFAGVEASYFLAQRSINVNLFEMRDKKQTPVHKTNYFAELVCSNSFKSNSLENAHGLLKKELEESGSLIIKTAYETSVPAGGALAVDRELFAGKITEIIKSNKNINFINDEVVSLENFIKNNEKVIIATGPITSSAMVKEIKKLINDDSLYFFDAEHLSLMGAP